MSAITSRLARLLAGAVACLTAATALTVLGAGTAAADPSPNAWYQLRMCESSNRYDINTGNGYYGAYQFSLSTWASVGGTGLPSAAKPAEQDYRALILYRLRGWSPWTCAAMIGLHEDADARSGVMPPVPATFDTPYTFVSGASGTTSGTGSTGTAGTSGSAPQSAAAPPWPNRQFSQGDSSDDLKVWQRQLSALGYDVVATGYFGPSTAAAVKDIQTKAGINVTGYIGPETWAAAWTLPPVAAGTGTGSAGTGSTGTGSATGGTVAGAPTVTGTDANVVYKPQTKADCHVGDTTAPAAPTALLAYNQTSLAIQCFQWQAATRGAALSGTAYFGTATLAVVQKLQSLSKITDEKDASGRAAIGPKTWKAAWEGTGSLA